VKQAIRIVAGIDVGDETSHVYAMDIATGEVLWDRAIPTAAWAFQDLFAKWRDVQVSVTSPV